MKKLSNYILLKVIYLNKVSFKLLVVLILKLLINKVEVFMKSFVIMEIKNNLKLLVKVYKKLFN